MEILLALPQSERRKIAKKLWNSLPPVTSVSKEDEKVISLLDKRWQNIQSNASKLYSTDEIKTIINSHRISVAAFVIKYDDGFFGDLQEAIDRYDNISKLLGDKFLDKVWFAEDKIKTNPFAFIKS